MISDDEDILALPLWINGHAYLTMTETFFDVINPASGEVLRRTPLCGADIAAKAVAAAQAALADWAQVSPAARLATLSSIADALEGYDAHFAALITAETGKNAAAAALEVAAAVALLRQPEAPSVAPSASVVALVNDDRQPLLGALRLAVPALLAGDVLVVKPSPKAPSAVFAFAELTTRCGLPAGVFNILQGDLAAIEGLCAQADVGRLAFCGDALLGDKLRTIAERNGKIFAALS